MRRGYFIREAAAKLVHAPANPLKTEASRHFPGMLRARLRAIVRALFSQPGAPTEAWPMQLETYETFGSFARGTGTVV